MLLEIAETLFNRLQRIEVARGRRTEHDAQCFLGRRREFQRVIVERFDRRLVRHAGEALCLQPRVEQLTQVFGDQPQQNAELLGEFFRILRESLFRDIRAARQKPHEIVRQSGRSRRGWRGLRRQRLSAAGDRIVCRRGGIPGTTRITAAAPQGPLGSLVSQTGRRGVGTVGDGSGGGGRVGVPCAQSSAGVGGALASRSGSPNSLFGTSTAQSRKSGRTGTFALAGFRSLRSTGGAASSVAFQRSR